MPLTQRHVDELKAIYRARTGAVLSDAEAWNMASNLLEYVRLLREIAGESANSSNSESLSSGED